MKRQNPDDNRSPSGGNFKRSRPDMYNEALAEGKFELRILLPNRCAGAIIGKGGEYIKAIRDKFEASLTVPDRSTAERVLNIVARQEVVVDCFKEVLVKLAELQENQKRDELDVRMLIHQSHAGGVIGRGGSKIKEFREQTGVNLKVFQEVCPYSTDRVVLISGSIEKIPIALQAIIDFIKEIPVKGIQKPYDASNYDPRMAYDYGGFEMPGGGRFGGGGSRGGRGPPMGGRGPPGRGPPMGGRGLPPPSPYGDYRGPPGGGYGGAGYGGGGYGRGGPPPMGAPGAGYMGDPGPVTSTQVTIPNELGGTIIGKGGERINRIRMESGARIDVAKATGNEERIITITGSPHQIQSAQYLLQQSVRASKAGRQYLQEHR